MRGPLESVEIESPIDLWGICNEFPAQLLQTADFCDTWGILHIAMRNLAYGGESLIVRGITGVRIGNGSLVRRCEITRMAGRYAPTLHGLRCGRRF